MIKSEKPSKQTLKGENIKERCEELSTIAAFWFMNPDFISIFKKSASIETEKSPAVRRFALRTIKQNPNIWKDAPDMLPFLKTVFNQDSSEIVQEAADDALLALFPEKQNIIKKATEQQPSFTAKDGSIFVKITDPNKKSFLQNPANIVFKDAFIITDGNIFERELCDDDMVFEPQ